MHNRLPDPGAGFVWSTIDGGDEPGPVLRPVVDGITAAFTTRLGGTSPAPFDTLNVSFAVGDDDECVRANRERAGRAVGGTGSWSVVRQIHGCRLVRAPSPGHLEDADGLWTDDAKQTLAVLGADCVPLLLTGPDRIAVVHAGWRGLAKGIVAKAVRELGTSVAVVAGPAIGPCCFEVDADVARRFGDEFGGGVVPAPRRVDLWTAAEAAATRAGAETFRAARLCTSCHPELFFSHRRDRGHTGRQALLARLSDG